MKCAFCGKHVSESEAVLLRLDVGAENYQTGESVGFRRDSVVLCSRCFPGLQDSVFQKVQAAVYAALQDKVWVSPVRLPAVGEKVYEVVDSYPIVEHIITKFEDGRYEAKAINPVEAGEISFTPFELSKALFLTKKDAQAEKTRRAHDKGGV